MHDWLVIDCNLKMKLAAIDHWTRTIFFFGSFSHQKCQTSVIVCYELVAMASSWYEVDTGINSLLWHQLDINLLPWQQAIVWQQLQFARRSRRVSFFPNWSRTPELLSHIASYQPLFQTASFQLRVENVSTKLSVFVNADVNCNCNTGGEVYKERFKLPPNSDPDHKLSWSSTEGKLAHVSIKYLITLTDLLERQNWYPTTRLLLNAKTEFKF